jgi:hypothetical protein
MTRSWEYLFPSYSEGYSVSTVEQRSDYNEDSCYDLNDDGTLCDVYVIKCISISIDLLLSLRKFIIQKGGTIYCERINACHCSPLDALKPSDFYGHIIVWTSQRVYNVWNGINENLVDTYGSDFDGILPDDVAACLDSDLHPGWYIKESVISSELMRGYNERKNFVGREKDGRVITNSYYKRFMDPFCIVFVHMDNLQCTHNDITSFVQSCKLVKSMLMDVKDQEIKNPKQISLFIFWPKNPPKISFNFSV